MDETSKLEKSKYEKIWRFNSYRESSPGYKSLEPFFDHFSEQITAGDSVTDFGCGMGLTTMGFLEKGLSVELVDIAENCLQDKIEALLLLQSDKINFTLASLWDLPETQPKTDWIYCTDVLEHIPPEKVDQVLSTLASKCDKGGLLQVFLIDETFGSLISEKLHLTIENQEWWTKVISKYFEIDNIVHVIKDIRLSYYVRPKGS